MKQTLPPQPWMSHPATARVMDALVSAAGVDGARFVGGCVRDALLGTSATDVDIATVLKPQAVMRALDSAGVRHIEPGFEHGTVTAIEGGRTVEITTLRRDIETDGRRARVDFTMDWAADAARRDFTINALYADQKGVVFDPVGRGLSDLRRGYITFVGDPRERIQEDALRILRYFRFLAWFGRGAPDPAAIVACAALKDLTEILSAERIQKEMMKLLLAEDPRPAMREMERTGVLQELLPQADGLSRFEALVEVETLHGFNPDPLLRLAALLHRDRGSAAAAAERLRLSNADRERLTSALCGAPPVSWMSPRECRRMLWRDGPRTVRDRVMLAWAQSRRPAADSQWRALLPMVESWPRPVFPLSGDEVVAAGVAPGPMVGAILREVETWWIDHDFPDDKLAVIERLKSVAQGMAF